MQARGFSLVEIIVVIGIISILTAIGTLSFGEYARRYRTEAQTRMIYGELLHARSSSLYQRRETRMKFYRERFEVYSSMLDSDSGVAPVTMRTLEFPIKWNGNDVNVDFDEKGMTADLGTICIDGSDLTGSVDSVVIANIRVSIGKKDQGGVCKGENIILR